MYKTLQSIVYTGLAKEGRQSIAQKIIRVFVIGAAILILTYWLLFRTSILVTENKMSMHRLVVIAPFHFKAYEAGEKGPIVIDPLLTSYDQHSDLPVRVQQSISPTWVGVDAFHFEENDSEFAVVSQQINNKNYYLVENSNIVEWSDGAFLFIEFILISCGVLLFVLASIAIRSRANQIALPFSLLAEKLSNDTGEEFSKLSVDGMATRELEQTLTGINNYREKIALAVEREQSFTRYVSHELRTPMTVVKGSLSLLRKQKSEAVDKQCKRIDAALNEMQSLTQTFLLLARDEVSVQEFTINQAFIDSQIEDLASYIAGNQCTVSAQLLCDVVVNAEVTLIKVLIKNLLINAINCSPQGYISIFIDEKQLSVIDNGSGLNHNHRGYEGFGIGLVLVRDICDKYHWSFSLKDNQDKGCTAKVQFVPE